MIPLDNILTTWTTDHGFTVDYCLRATYLHTIAYKLSNKKRGEPNWNLIPAAGVLPDDEFDVEDISEYLADVGSGSSRARKPRKRERAIVQKSSDLVISPESMRLAMDLAKRVLGHEEEEEEEEKDDEGRDEHAHGRSCLIVVS